MKPLLNAWRATLVLAAALSLALSGPGLAASPFFGVWSGPWSSVLDGQTGAFRWLVNPQGLVAGTVTNGSRQGLATGMIGDDGVVNLSYTYDGRDWFSARGRAQAEGGRLKGYVSYFGPDDTPIGASMLDLQGGPIGAGPPAGPQPAAEVAAAAPSTDGGSEASQLTVPTGLWRCVATPVVAGGLAPSGPDPRPMGQIWIYDAHHYAETNEAARGTYELQGRQIVPTGGPLAAENAALSFKPAGPDGPPLITILYMGTSRGLTCRLGA